MSWGGRKPSDWVVTGLLTAGVWLVARRLSALIPEPAVLCLAYLAPITLVGRSVACGAVSLLIVITAGGLALMDRPYALMGFIAVGLTFTSVALARAMSDAAKLAECRKGLSLTSARSLAYIRALESAGVPVVVLDQQGAWLSANLTAMHAVGMPEQVESLGRTNTELDHGAAEALMYSASRASWLAWMESFRAAMVDGGGKISEPYEQPITLFDRDGARTSYLMRALAGEEGETILVGCKAR